MRLKVSLSPDHNSDNPLGYQGQPQPYVLTPPQGKGIFLYG